MADERPAVLFDWGDTLVVIPGMLNAPEAHLACAREVYERDFAGRVAERARALDAARFIEVYHGAARQQIKQSAATLREHNFQDRLRMAFAECEVAGALTDAEIDAFAHALSMQVLAQAQLVDGATEAVQRLARRFRLGLLSNYPMPAVVVGTLAKFGMSGAFERVTISGELGWMKPHARAYEALLDGFVSETGRAVFVGDNLENDVIGPKRLGLKTAWYAPGKSTPDVTEIDFHAHSLADVVAWCERTLG